MRPRLVSDDEILEAARTCLVAHGPSVALSVIGARLGISGPAVLKRFGSKENLVTRALLSEPPPDFSHGPEPGPLRPQLIAILLHTERLLLEAVPRLATMRARGVRASEWLDRPHPRKARGSLLTWLKKARCTHRLVHPDLEAAADLLVSAAEARGFLAWVEPSWVEHGDGWAARAVDALFIERTPPVPKGRAGTRTSQSR